MKNALSEWIGYIVAALTSGSLSWLFTVRWTRQQAKSDAMKSVQDVYQELLEDLKRDREDIKQENEKLHSGAKEQNERIIELSAKLEEVSKKCNENGRLMREQEKRLAAMRPLVCTAVNCAKRQNITA